MSDVQGSVRSPRVTAARRAASLAVPAFAFSAACSDGTDSTRVEGAGEIAMPPLSLPGDDAPSDDTPGDGTPNSQSPRYMGTIGLALPGDLQTSHTAIVPQLDDSTSEGLQRGVETVGFVMASSYDGSVYIPGGSSPTITKYLADAQGRLTQVGQVSFAAYGVNSITRGPFIGSDMVSAEKAYYFDLATLQIIIWNPQTMQITGSVIDLSEVLGGPLESRGPIESPWDVRVFLNYGEGFARQRDDRLFIPVRWQNADDVAGFVRPMGGLLVLDTESDTVVHLLEDDRIADSIYTVLLDSGDLYLFSGAIGVSQNHLYENAAPGGAIRVRSGEDTFDPGYYLDLDQAVGGRPATTPVAADGTSIYVRAFHEDQAKPQTDPFELLALQAWRYWKVDLAGAEPAREITELPWTSTDGYFYSFPQENRTFLGVMSSDYSATTLYEATPSGFIEAFQVTGTLNALSRLDRTQ